MDAPICQQVLVEALQEIRDSGSQPASVHIGTGLSASYVLDAFEGAGIFIDESAMHVLQHFLFKHKERASKKGLLYRSVQDLGYQTYTSRTC